MKRQISTAVALLLATTKAGKCPYGYGSSDDSLAQTDSKADYTHTDGTVYLYPSEMFPGGVPTTADDFVVGDYEAIVADIDAKYDSLDNDDDRS